MKSQETLSEQGGNEGVRYKLVDGDPGYRVGSDGTAWTKVRQIGLGPGKGTKSSLRDEWRKLRIFHSKAGYSLVAFRGEQVRLCRVILEAFVGPCPPGMQCRHLDGNNKNDVLENLAWGTPKENAEDRDNHGTTARGSKIKNSILTEEQVYQIHKLRHVYGWVQTDLAVEFNYRQSNIAGILAGKRWKHVYDRFWKDHPDTPKVKRARKITEQGHENARTP